MPLLNDRNFEQDIKTGVSVVKFSSLWNMDSRAFEEQFRQLSEEFSGKARFIVSDVNASSVAKKEGVTTIPTIAVYVNGTSVAKITGVTKRYVREVIDYFVKKYV